mmetsp:Transcript_40113/g.64675  ORF Transcript_40113/g.64675 Transcript_40113/m.64675 type:complete len:97 (+) Transcript_40113:82-372(+)
MHKLDGGKTPNGMPDDDWLKLDDEVRLAVDNGCVSEGAGMDGERGVMRAKGRECNHCGARESLLSKMSSIDWTADELHLNAFPASEWKNDVCDCVA